MLKLRTKLLLFAIGVSGIGIGGLAGIADGAYSAICLFALPLFVALAAAAIISDFGSVTTQKTETAPQRESLPVPELPSFPRMRASHQQHRLHEVAR